MESLKNMKEKKYLTVDDHILDKVLDKIKKIIGIEKFDDNKILIEINDTLPDDVVVIVITRVIKDEDKFYSQLFLVEALHDE